MRWTERDVWTCATSMGLDPFPTEFHTVPAHVLYDIAARGMPGRYSYWGYGKDYFHEITRHEHGLGRIYELVINANPSQAFLLDANSDVINLMVMTHVLGHTDFFKHNRTFADTCRDMPDRAALRAERIRQYEERYGLDAVEQTLDALLALEFYVDPDGYTPQHPVLDKESPEKDRATQRRFAGLPCRDVLGFLIAEAPLDDWQKDIGSIVREDGLYFWPQIRTKTINEGWASFWHGKLMHELDLSDGEFMEFAKINAGVVCCHPGALNPYWLGLNILADIEHRHGRERLFQVRRLETDSSLVRNYLTRELVEELGLIRYGFKGDAVVVTEDNWESIRDTLANDFCARFPEIQVADRDYGGTGGLLLEHVYDGRPLKQRSAFKVLEHIHSLWRRPVYLQTLEAGKSVVWYYDGRTTGSRSV
ncbi:MAG TPA: SpoVR family protein [Symbiobacteriaceae bacterium]|nr:SpoVR family protein [Symbiobacteriaceae bacterium]